MKQITCLLIFCGIFAVFGFLTNSQAEKIELSKDFKAESMFRIIEGNYFDIRSTVSLNSLVVFFSSDIDESTVKKVERKFNLKLMERFEEPKKISELDASGQRSYRWYMVESADNLEALLGIIKEIWERKEIDFVSPVFNLIQGPSALDGSIAVKLKVGISKEFFQQMIGLDSAIGKMRLDKTIFNKDDDILSVRVNKDSGQNVFYFAYLLDPASGEYRTVFAQPNFVFLKKPILIETSIKPRLKEHLGAGVKAGDPLKVTFKISYSEAVKIREAELDIGTEKFKSWLPVNYEVGSDLSPRLFKIFPNVFNSRSFEIIHKGKENNRILVEVSYVIAILEPGEWIIPPLNLFFDLENFSNKRILVQELTPPFLVKIGSLLPTDIRNVNDIETDINIPEIPTPLILKFRKLHNIPFIPAAILGVLFFLGFLKKIFRKPKEFIAGDVIDSREFFRKFKLLEIKEKIKITNCLWCAKEILGRLYSVSNPLTKTASGFKRELKNKWLKTSQITERLLDKLNELENFQKENYERLDEKNMLEFQNIISKVLDDSEERQRR